MGEVSLVIQVWQVMEDIWWLFDDGLFRHALCQYFLLAWILSPFDLEFFRTVCLLMFDAAI